MDIDFSLILVILTAVSLVCWLAHRRWYDPARMAGASAGDPEQQSEGSVAAILRVGRELFPVLALVLVLRSFLVEPFQIPSGSMIPTLQVGDFILVNKYAYGLRLPVIGTKIVPVGEPQRGDVMVFRPPDDKRHFIKRVIGVPGDRIEVSNKVLTINGEEMAQSLADETFLCDARNPLDRRLCKDGSEVIAGTEHQIRLVAGHRAEAASALGIKPSNFTYIVPDGHYFMMGDNRDNSRDSRFFGPVPGDRVVGKAFFVWLHWEDFFSLPSFEGTGRIH